MADRITDEMVEAAARAIFASNFQYEPPGGYDEMPPLGKKMARINARAALSAALPLMESWIPIEGEPVSKHWHRDIELYREDAGIMFGQYTNCSDWVSEGEQATEQYDDETLYGNDFWSFDHMGATRLEGDCRPTHYRLPLPPAPKEG